MDIKLVKMMGDDEFITQAARVSNDLHDVEYSNDKVRSLIRYLYRNEHLTPFEMVTTIWKVKVPIAIARQWMRHRMGSFNEISRRYVDKDPEYYRPTLRKRALNKKQGSDESSKVEPHVDWIFDDAYTHADVAYKQLLEGEVAPEVARFALPLGVETEFFWKVDLRNLFHFLELRMHDHAQKEIRDCANRIYGILMNEVPELKHSLQIFTEMNDINNLVRDLKNTFKDEPLHLKQLLLELYYREKT